MSQPRTRMALLTLRARLSLARRGQELLERKRDALVRELAREVRVVLAAQEELAEAAAAARRSLEEATVWLGSDVVAAAAAAAGTGPGPSLELHRASVLGVAVPAIEPRSLIRAPAARDRDSAASGPALELVAERFEEELTIAVRVATTEVRVRRLAREIERANRRVNALRMQVVPRLEVEARAIVFTLDQREREERHRVKRAKRRVGGARAAR